MATLVSFHAHPDDECIACGGVLRKAAEEGHRTVLVVATGGECGEVVDGVLEPGEPLGVRRAAETRASAEILGVARVEFLGYTDSGMMGTETNDAPGSFWTAPVGEAAAKLAAVLREEAADVLTIYDSNGGYGHPDHIQVHHVGAAAAELAETPRVYQSTINRDRMIQVTQQFAARAEENGFDVPDLENDPNFGVPASAINVAVDVRGYLEHKRRAMRAHASQIPADSFFLAMPDEVFAGAFGTEWFIRGSAGAGITETDLLAGVPSHP